MQQPITRSKALTAVLISSSMMGACHSTSNQHTLPGSASAPGDPTSQAVAWSLSPGPPGTPLPPRNPHAADDWPPEFKRFIDAALELFKSGNPEPTLEEFETKLGIKLVPFDWKKVNDTWRQAYLVEAPWVKRAKPSDPLWVAASNALIELPMVPKGARAYLLKFWIDEESPWCISPYSLAIYTGANFSNNDQGPHQVPRPIWPSAYEWGMFKRGYYGRYVSNMGFSIGVNATNLAGPAQQDATCVVTFNFSARFQSN